MRNGLLILTATTLLCFGTTALAEDVPEMITVQGLLTDAGGTPVANAEYSVRFSIYDVASDGSALWSETRNVGTTDGVFTTLVGSDTPISDAAMIVWAAIPLRRIA